MKSAIVKTLAICGLCVVSVHIVGCKKGDTEANAKNAADSSVVRVVTKPIVETSFEDWGSYSSDLRGIEDAYLTAPYQGGRVNAVKAVGSRVKAGEPLCDIDGEKYDAAQQAAAAAVQVAQGELERAKANVEKGSLGRSVLDAANLGYQNARMMQVSAQRAYEDCHCSAPFNGILVSRTIEKYQSVAPGMPTMRISRVDRLEATIAIPETEAFAYADGMKAEFTLLQDPLKIYEGKISTIDRAVDARTRTATARITIVNPDGSLKPGMVGRTRILRKNYEKAIVIPSTALLRLQNGVSVMIAENGVAKQHLVTVGATVGDNVMITEGIDAGELLIVSGGFQVSEGTKVTY